MMLNDRAGAPHPTAHDETRRPQQDPAYAEQELPADEQDQSFGPYLKEQIMRRAVPTAF